jgi:deoxyribonuclease-1-like protein
VKGDPYSGLSMIQLRRQWPAATALIAGLAFILNHYRISGLENIHLERRSPTEVARREGGGDMWSTGLLNDALGHALPNGLGLPNSSSDPFTPNSTPAFQAGTANNFPSTQPPTAGRAPAASGAPDLGRMLSASEKFAIWEQKSTTAGSLSGATTSSSGTLRVASFHIQALGATKLAKPHVFEMLVRTLRRFDVIALQGIQSNRDDILPMLVERLNQSGGSYDYMIGPRVGHAAPLEQFAFVFDTQRLETDRYQLYTVEDPDDLISREPLVAWFRTRGHAAHQAFTFSMINVCVDPDFAERERQLLPTLIQAVQNDGRGEDDWILLGDFGGGDSELFPLTKAGTRLALIGVPTNVSGTQMLDEIAFSGAATVEFNGKVGVYDFLRQYNLSLEQALEVSEHLPIWAEFSTLEGAEPGRIAPIAGEIH